MDCFASLKKSECVIATVAIFSRFAGSEEDAIADEAEIETVVQVVTFLFVLVNGKGVEIDLFAEFMGEFPECVGEHAAVHVHEHEPEPVSSSWGTRRTGWPGSKEKEA